MPLWPSSSGFLGLAQAQEWVVTTKLGSSSGSRGNGSRKKNARAIGAAVFDSFRLYGLEGVMSVFVLGAGLYGIFMTERFHLALFVTLQGVDATLLLRCVPSV